jgi:hypothetical protein
MLEIIKSQRFQSEYQDFKDKIEKIASGEMRNQAEQLLKTLVNEVKKLDIQHQDMFSGNLIPTGISDTRGDVTAARKKLNTLLNNKV